MQLLVVDDDDLTCRGFQNRILSLRLEEIECVHTAFSAEEALQVLQSCRIDGVITDIQMVDMDGLDLIEEIRRHDPWIPCAIISAHDKFHYAQRAIRLDVEDFLLKPCDLEEIRSVVLKFIERAKRAGGPEADAEEGAVPVAFNNPNDAVSWAIHYARESFDKDITMATVANKLDMNYSYFSRLFKSQVGKTFSEFMIEVKMQEAGKMLLRGCRVEEVADALGYYSTQNFSRAFAKFWGMTTRVFRRTGGEKATEGHAPSAF